MNRPPLLSFQFSLQRMLEMVTLFAIALTLIHYIQAAREAARRTKLP